MYRRIIIGSGVGSAVVAAGYAAAAGMAASPEIELSSRVGAVCLTLILGLGMISYSTWLIGHAVRAAAVPSADVVAERAAERIAVMLGLTLNDVADKQHARTVASFRDVVESKLIGELLDHYVQKAKRYGMVTEAMGRADNGTNNVARIH